MLLVFFSWSTTCILLESFKKVSESGRQMPDVRTWQAWGSSVEDAMFEFSSKQNVFK